LKISKITNQVQIKTSPYYTKENESGTDIEVPSGHQQVILKSVSYLREVNNRT